MNIRRHSSSPNDYTTNNSIIYKFNHDTGAIVIIINNERPSIKVLLLLLLPVPIASSDAVIPSSNLPPCGATVRREDER